MRKFLAPILCLFAFGSVGLGADQKFTVENHCTATHKFVVENKTSAPKASTPVAVVRSTSGCGCSSGFNCSAGFCKANGGAGCPASCPIKVAPVAASEGTVYSLPSATSSCPNGNCANSTARPARGIFGFRR